jgi:cytochrome c peroxidase
MTLRNGFVLITGLLAGSACVTGDESGVSEPDVSEAPQSLTLAERITLCQNDARVVVGKLSIDTCVGADLFFRESFNGNGRSCATCHRVDRNLVIDPAFMSTLGSNDPLFVAEFNPSLIQLEVPTMMRRFGLILENVDGFSPDPRTRFVLRSVPHSLSMATSITNPPGSVSPPANRTGWSGDGAPGNGALRDFQTGAITQHYPKTLSRTVGTDFRLATTGELDRIDRFLRTTGRLNELDLNTIALTDAAADAGRARFLTVGCNACHSNAGANASFGGGGNRNFNTGVETARHAALAGFARDGGFGGTAQPDGSFGDGTFNTPPLIEAADTGPFFHTAITTTGSSGHDADFVTTIEEAVAFYDTPAFNNSPSGQAGPINMTDAEIINIGRFLRVLNAAFNVAQASKRIDAVIPIIGSFGDGARGTQLQLLRLAAIDLQDAINVLNAVNLNPTQSSSINQANSLLRSALNASTASQRLSLAKQAQQLAVSASSGLGTNLNIQIGEGTVTF